MSIGGGCSGAGPRAGAAGTGTGTGTVAATGAAGVGGPHGLQTIESLKEVFALRLGAVDFLVLLALAIATAALTRRTARVLTAPKAVMRSQNRARERSRLHQSTFASNSPPLPSTVDNSPQEPPQTSSPPRVVRASTTKLKPPVATDAASVPSCPSSAAISPAYPFPPMRSFSSSTIGASFSSPGAGPLDKLLPSGAPTPASVAFHPSGSKPASACENPDFPTPNMYDLTLLLHSEPGIEAFWSNVVKIATTCYKAERVTLAVPSDSTDLENTPWGQKATFNMAEDDQMSLTYMGDDQGRRVGDPDGGGYSEGDDGYQGVEIPKDEEPPPNFSPDQAGGQMDLKIDLDLENTEPVHIDTSPDSPSPFGPITIGLQDTLHDSSDWVSVTSGAASPTESPKSPTGKEAREAMEQAQNAFASEKSEVKGRVFPTLQPLNYEADALLDETGVSRVLQRGKTVVLSREYRDVKTHLEEKKRRKEKDAEFAKSSPAKSSSEDRKPLTPGPSTTAGLSKIELPTSQFRSPSQPPTPLIHMGKGTRRKRKIVDSYSNNVLQYYSTPQHLHHVQSRSHSPNRSSAYEEYEQAITSPWSQSPAPSPAPRPDPSENPFFASVAKVDEETFNPATISPIYSAQEPVSAIGCESSWTVIHIPLVHPSQSKGLNLTGLSTSESLTCPKSMFGGANTFDEIGGRWQKKAPIAILSMLSPVIPYPSNLIHSLSHFAPLVATAFSLANTHTSVLNQLNSFRKMRPRRPLIPRQLSYMSEEFQSSETQPASVTSPSDSSSTFTMSNVTSPTCDGSSAALVTTASYSLKPVASSHTPFSPLSGGGDDGYFTGVCGQPIFSRQHSGMVPTIVPKGEDPESYTSLEARLLMRDREELLTNDKGTNENGAPSTASPNPAAEPTPSEIAEADDDATPTPTEKGKGKQVESEAPEEPRKAPKKPRKRRVRPKTYHSYLHSYGADYASTFQPLGAGPSGRRSTRGRHPNLNLHEMPPPSNRLLRTIIDSIPVHVFTAIPDTGQITWVNARMLRYRGVTAEEFLQAPWDAIHPEEREDYLRQWREATRKGEPFSYQMRVRRFDGDYRWFMVRAVPLRDQRGIIVHWFGTNMDIHDQRLAEVNAARQAEMAESEHKYRSLANSSPQIVFAATANDGITFANTQWLGYSGQTLEQVLQLGFIEYVHPGDRHKCCLPGNGPAFPGMSDALKSPSAEEARRTAHEWSGGDYTRGSGFSDQDDKPTFSTELRLKDKHGNYRWHLVRCVSVDSNADNASGLWFGTCTDINDHKLLEQKLKEANEAAQRTMDSKTRFLANMSHEIRKAPGHAFLTFVDI
jgi:PAS domain S-box-containing protein